LTECFKGTTWPEEIELRKAGKLGVDNPETLIHTVWFTLTQNTKGKSDEIMGLRGTTGRHGTTRTPRTRSSWYWRFCLW
jgi:hypothetical protein